MKQKILIKVMVLCVLVVFLNVNAVTADAAKSKDDLQKDSKVLTAQQFYENLKNNDFSGAKIDINIKNQDVKHLISIFASLAKIPIIYKGKQKKIISCKIDKIHYDFLFAYLIEKCDLKIELDGNKIIVTDKNE